MKIIKKIAYWLAAMVLLGYSWVSMISRNSGATMMESLGGAVWPIALIGVVLAAILLRLDMDK
jgi:hypothetical protein